MDKGKYLDSWKEIAAYLGRNIRTCRNWEQDLGLPVHRLEGSPKSRVFAYAGEIDAWREEKGRLPGNGEPNGTVKGGSLILASAPESPGGTVRILRPVVVGAAILLAVIATAIIVWRLRPTPESEVERFIIKVEPGYCLDGWRWDIPTRTSFAVSSDGKFIVYSAIEANSGPEAIPRLFLRRMDRSQAEAIGGTEGGIYPFLSPDDRWVGFWADDALMKCPVEGGIPALLCRTDPWPYGADWGVDGNIVFSAGWDSGLMIVPAGGGKPEVLTTPAPRSEEVSHRLPRFLPSGKSVLFTIMREPWDTHPDIALLDLGSRKYKVLQKDGADARYVRTGHLVFLRLGTLMAVPFEAAKPETKGQAVPVVSGIMQAISGTHVLFSPCAAQVGISDSGLLVYVKGGPWPDLENTLVWVDHQGNEETVTSFTAAFHVPRLSPDGQTLAVSCTAGDYPTYIYDLTRGVAARLTGEGKRNCGIWTPDGRRLIFGWWVLGLPHLGWQKIEGGSQPESLSKGEYIQWSGSVTPDGTTLAYVEENSETSSDICLMRFADRVTVPFLNSPFAEQYPDFSPNGRFLAYSSNEGGLLEVYVRSYPDHGGKWKISLDYGTEPLWSRDGKRLFYRSENQVWMVDVRTDRGFEPSKPRMLFEKPGYRLSMPTRCWDISMDGRRFLMVKTDPRTEAPATEMNIVKNWFEELKLKVPERNE